MFLSADEEKRRSSSFNLGSSLEKGTSINKNYFTDKKGEFGQNMPAETKKKKYPLKFVFLVPVFCIILIVAASIYYYKFDYKPTVIPSNTNTRFIEKTKPDEKMQNPSNPLNPSLAPKPYEPKTGKSSSVSVDSENPTASSAEKLIHRAEPSIPLNKINTK